MSAAALDIHGIDLPMLVAALLASAVVLACSRLLLRQRRAAPAQRARPWRIAVLLLAQPLCATLLYFALLPPTSPGEAGTMVVATAGATTALLEAKHVGQAADTLVALPEAPALPDAERTPDLATALRRHPGTQRLRVVGAGLEARDRDAAGGLAIDWVPTALPRGLVELAEPPRVVAGGEFRIGGRAEGLRGGFAELLDPGRQRVDRIALSGEGRFTLSGIARVPGAATFVVRLRDATQQRIEDIEIPLQVEADAPARVLLLAGAPGPEWKYLRRWVRDAGLDLHTQFDAGSGLQLGDAPIALNAANLARFDLVVLDERAWSALAQGQRAALDEAVRGGLGLLLRVTAALSEPERRRLRALGFQADGGRDSATIRLAPTKRDTDAERARIGPGTRDAPRQQGAALADVPALTRRALRIDANDAVALRRDDTANAFGIWRTLGRGRVATWTLTDSYRLVLAGRSDVYGELWSRAFATLARAQPRDAFAVEGEARQGERVALCGVAADGRVIAPDGAVMPLLPDPAAGPRHCAAFWPRAAGWHRLQSGNLQSGDRARPFHVRARDEATGLHAGLLREATMRLAADAPRIAPDATAASTSLPHPGARWPWWLAWLLASAGLWWLERSRAGRVEVTAG